MVIAVAATVVATILIADAPDELPDTRATPEVGTPAVTRAAVNVVAPEPEVMLVTACVMELEEVAAVVTVNATVMPPCRRWRPLELDAATLVIVMALLATFKLLASVLMNAVRTVVVN
jgi:hypothetical protein